MAQPASLTTDSAAVSAVDSSAWKKLRQDTAALELTSPGEAVLRYREFLRQHPGLEPGTAIDGLVAIIDIYEDRLHDAGAAKAIRQWALLKYTSHPDSHRLNPYASPSDKKWRRYRESFADLERDKPAEAVLRYWVFAKTNPDLEANVGVQVVLAIIDLYETRLDDQNGASAVRKWGQERYASRPDLVRQLDSAFHAELTNSATVAANLQKMRSAPLNIAPVALAADVMGSAATTILPGTGLTVKVTQSLHPIQTEGLTIQFNPWHSASQSLQPVKPMLDLGSEGFLKARTADLARRLPLEKVTEPLASTSGRKTTNASGSNPMMDRLFEKANRRFWSVEPIIYASDGAIHKLAPLKPLDSSAAAYRQAALAAEGFLALQTKSGHTDGRTPNALYVAAMSYSRLGEHKAALRNIDGLLARYPDFKEVRPQEEPGRGRPVRGELEHLKLYHLDRLLTGAKQPAKVLAMFGSKSPVGFLNAVARAGEHSAFSAEAREAALENSGMDGFDNDPTPAQLRAAASPDLRRLMMRINEKVLPLALQKQTPQAVRDYLRTLTPDGTMGSRPFSGYAFAKLKPLDRQILSGYQATVDRAVAELRWDDAKTAYRRIITEYQGKPAGWQAKEAMYNLFVGMYKAEGEKERVAAQTDLGSTAAHLDNSMAVYSKIIDEFKGTSAAVAASESLREVTLLRWVKAVYDSERDQRFEDAKIHANNIIKEYPDEREASWAKDEIVAIKSMALAHYKSEGDKYFQSSKIEQFGIPQTKAREYFQKMYEEDPDGSSADYALYYWARALGTEGKTDEALELYSRLLSKFPDSPLVPAALLSSGFIHGSNRRKEYTRAIEIITSLVNTYPESDKCPEGLWYAAFWLAYAEPHRYDDASKMLERLKKEYPTSVYTAEVDEELKRYEKWKKDGFGT